MGLTYTEPFEDQEKPGVWRVESIDDVTREIRIVLFGADDAEKLAAEYYAFKTGKLKVAVSHASASAPELDCDRCGQSLAAIARHHYSVLCHKPGCMPEPKPAVVGVTPKKRYVIGDEPTFVGVQRNGEPIEVNYGAFYWSHDEKRDKITGYRKNKNVVRRGR